MSILLFLLFIFCVIVDVIVVAVVRDLAPPLSGTQI